MWHSKWQLAERVWIARAAATYSSARLDTARATLLCACSLSSSGRQAGRTDSSPGSLVCNIVAAYINWALQLIWIRRGKRKTEGKSRRKRPEKQTESRTGFPFNCLVGQLLPMLPLLLLGLLTYGNRCLYRLMPSHTRRMSYQASFAVPSRTRTSSTDNRQLATGNWAWHVSIYFN